ncbi:MAG: hypothetical protein C5B60_11460 [Chloroflexi bacterium]|nr:MAG: hypothetical protein C5B60_11460 [Chloroflexota bacterium]
MPTVSDLIHSSARLIGAIAAGETLETNELNDAFISLNQMIASWNTEGLSTAGRMPVTVAVTTANSYTLPVRPIKIDAANVAISGINAPLEIVDAAGWEAISEKGAIAIFVQKIFCDYQYPTSTVYLWPTPRLSGTLELFVYAPIAAFVTVNDTINLPPGYEQALRFNFAVNLLPEYPRSQVDPSLAPQAQNTKASLVQLNASVHRITPVTQSATALAAQGNP